MFRLASAPNEAFMRHPNRKAIAMKNATTKTRPALKVCFARKPYNLDSALNQLHLEDEAQPIKVQSTCRFTATQYDGFVEHFLSTWDFLAGRGGVENGYRLVVKVSAPRRRTLYIDPSGSDYARYVGFADEA